MIKRGVRAQVTIWIILAIVIVAVIILLFALKVPQRLFTSSNPNIQLGDCLQEELKNSLGLISSQGGSIDPVNSIMYKDNEIEYLCYTNEYYKTCVMQQPLLKQHVERELVDNLTPKVEECLEIIKASLESKGYNVASQGNQVSLELEPYSLKLVVSGITAEKEASVSYNKFVVEEKTNTYDFLMFASSILNWEARYGDADITTYMAYYPNIKVEKYKQSDGSKIYILSRDNEQFMFATRSLSWPAGYGFGQTYKPTV